MGLSNNMRDVEGLVLSKDDFTAHYKPNGPVEVVPRIRRPFGCSPVGPTAWLAVQSYDLNIETCEGMIPNRDNLDFGHQTMRRLRLELQAELAKSSAEAGDDGTLPGFPSSKKRQRKDDGKTSEGGVLAQSDTKRKEGRKNARSQARSLFEQLIFPYRHSHWHIWLCPIGPYIVDELAADSAINLQYAVCWADIVYLFHCKHYHQRFCDVYHTIMEFMRAGVNILIDPEDSWLTYIRYMHVFSSIYIHIQVMEKYNSRIGGNWDDVIDTLRNIQRDLHREWEMDPVEIGLMAEQFSVENIRELSNGKCGKGLNQIFSRRQRALL